MRKPRSWSRSSGGWLSSSRKVRRGGSRLNIDFYGGDHFRTNAMWTEKLPVDAATAISELETVVVLNGRPGIGPTAFSAQIKLY